MINKALLRLYAITDERINPEIPLEKKVEAAIRGGATIIQYREKTADTESKKNNAKKLHNVCKRYGVPLIINDDVFLAKEIDAEGVHIGQNDMNIEQARDVLGDDKIIGVTAKTVEQAVTAYEQGADYLGSGAIFGSTTKTDAIPMDMCTLRSICESVPIPVVAIGGINIDNVDALKDIPIAGIAVVGGVFAKDNIEREAQKLIEKLTSIV